MDRILNIAHSVWNQDRTIESILNESDEYCIDKMNDRTWYRWNCMNTDQADVDDELIEMIRYSGHDEIHAAWWDLVVHIQHEIQYELSCRWLSWWWIDIVRTLHDEMVYRWCSDCTTMINSWMINSWMNESVIMYDMNSYSDDMCWTDTVLNYIEWYWCLDDGLIDQM